MPMVPYEEDQGLLVDWLGGGNMGFAIELFEF